MVPSAQPAADAVSDFDPASGLQVDDELLARILAAMQGMKYGQISIAVHDGHVVQLDRVQQVRLFRKSEPRRKRDPDA